MLFRSIIGIQSFNQLWNHPWPSDRDRLAPEPSDHTLQPLIMLKVILSHLIINSSLQSRWIVQKHPRTMHGSHDQSMRPPWTAQHPAVHNRSHRALGLGACMHVGPARMRLHARFRRARLHRCRSPPSSAPCHLLQTSFACIFTIQTLFGLFLDSLDSVRHSESYCKLNMDRILRYQI